MDSGARFNLDESQTIMRIYSLVLKMVVESSLVEVVTGCCSKDLCTVTSTRSWTLNVASVCLVFANPRLLNWAPSCILKRHRIEQEKGRKRKVVHV